jgi:hypothetical protein
MEERMNQKDALVNSLKAKLESLTRMNEKAVDTMNSLKAKLKSLTKKKTEAMDMETGSKAYQHPLR